MGDSSEKGGELVAPVRNRKRFLEASEDQHEEESNSRRQNLLSEWHETLRSMGVPSKKGFIGNESQYNDMIAQGLAENLEDSLSDLGVDISTASYNMSDAVLALPTVGIFKHEPNSVVQKTPVSTPSTFDESSQSNTTDRFFKLLSSDTFSEAAQSSPSIHQLLQQHITFPTDGGGHGPEEPTREVTSSELQSDDGLSLASTHDEVCDPTSIHTSIYESNRFQYILGAATSVAMKMNEESLTYLNQGQSYEIKVKKLGDITGCQGKFYHTVIRICFHERRLQYMEKEQMAAWRQMRPGERILEIDEPLSYGILDVIQAPKYLNIVKFNWEPVKEVGVYVKVNCISTEFTPKKHGGEKGVPFRIQVETYLDGSSQNNMQERLHACACQIKVFKLKGADRKHKQDREKIMKRSAYEINKYQRQCDCTILQEISPENLHIVSYEDEDPTPPHNSSKNCAVTKVPANHDSSGKISPTHLPSQSWDSDSQSNDQKQLAYVQSSPPLQLDADATADETQMWLVSHRFSNLAPTFANFTGTDIFCLSREELIEICGLVDGIRLFNTLHAKGILPRLTLYLCLEPQMPYSAVYLKNLTLSEFIRKISELLKVSSECVHDVCLQGPFSIDVLVTDEVVRNFKNESTFLVKILQDTSGEKFRILLQNSNEIKPRIY